MDHEMAPPNKRRRLSRPTSQSLPSHSDFVSDGPSPTLLHSVEQLNHKPLSTPARTVPHHIQEIHLQIQERAAVLNKGYRPLHPRQATAVDQLITTINDQGQTITTDITVGATTADPSPAASGTAESTGASNSSSSTSTKLSDTGGTTTALGNSHNGTATHTSTKDSTGHDSTTLPSGVFLATLTNGHLVTITRSKDPYKTTFIDGEVSTICGRNSKCKLKTAAGTKSSDKTSLTSTSPSATTSTAYAAGGPAHKGAASPSSSTSAAAQSNNNDSSTPPPGTIAGGVVGGAAGLAVLILLVMILLRWYRRRKQFGHHALPPSAAFSPDPETSSSRGPGMAERAGIRPLANAVPGFFKHQNRSDVEPPPSERSFQKISGRKLPSAYSEGISSADINGPGYSVPSTGVPSTGVPSTGQDRNLSSLSFYRDSQGFYGGEGDGAERSVSPDDIPPIQSDNSGVLLSPGPQRKPMLHTGGPYNMTPSSSVPSTPNMQSPNLATIPGSPTEQPRAIQRSSTPASDNRSSRFTEEV